jgi:malonyl-CoA/methylmalonyl-CoA synthetase
MLLPLVAEPSDREALTAGGRTLTYRELQVVASQVSTSIPNPGTIAVWATPALETCVAVVGILLAGATALPLNPKMGERELEHILGDSQPDFVLAGPNDHLPEAFTAEAVPRINVDLDGSARPRPTPDEERPAFVFYTSGTTGPPKGVLLSRRAVAANLDALATVWKWTLDDVLTHALPLFHVHGLILGVLGPLRVGGALRHAGRFGPETIAAELTRGATMLFAVPTMYRDLVEAAESEDHVAAALGRARLLVSGSAPLPIREFERLERSTGQRVVERYGLTETIMNCAVHADGERRAGWVGPPLPGVDLKLLDDAGGDVPWDGETIGEIAVRGPNLFDGYLNRPDATAAVMREGWFHTGDMAVRSPDGYVRIVGRRATDLIKTGGYKVGAGEVEGALLEHPAVAECAVAGEPDERLGERIVAWVVLRPEATRPSPKDLEDHVAALLAPHKRPRDVRFLDALPRNDMGKVMKGRLRSAP